MAAPMNPIGFIESVFKEKNGTPRQANVCKESTGRLTLNKTVFTNPHHALEGLNEFSHVWLIFVFHKNNGSFHAKVAPPRLNGRRVGVLGTRSPHRPNPIGLSLAKLDKVEDDTLHLSMIDLLDGTPVLDIKPYIPQYDRPIPNETAAHSNELTADQEEKEFEETVKIPDWICRPPIEELRVNFTERATTQLKGLCQTVDGGVDNFETTVRAIRDILKEDPRSVYRRNRCKDRLYYLTVLSVHLTCWFDEDDRVVEVLKVKRSDLQNRITNDSTS